MARLVGWKWFRLLRFVSARLAELVYAAALKSALPPIYPQSEGA